MEYKALTYINLPPDNRKAPGDMISDKELEEANQSAEDIQALIDGKMIGTPEDDIDESHAQPETPEVESSDVNVVTNESGGGDESEE